VIAATKFECFCSDPTETLVFAGNASGQICVVDIDEFVVKHEVQAHSGVVQAITCHRKAPYVAALSTDRHVSLWRYDESGNLFPVCQVNLRYIKPDNDTDVIPYVHSTSQAIGFHDQELRVVTRSANAGLLEINFGTDGKFQVLNCRRIHGDSDLITARYVRNSDAVLSGSINGEFVMSERGEPVRRWNVGLSNVHWIEHVEDDTYLLASDARCVARIGIATNDDVTIGERITRDDLEHVTFNHTSGRAFVGSFDRNVYEIDRVTCGSLRIAFQAPFKCRWVKTLERAPSIGIVQCRNGALYKVDVDSGEILATLRSTPTALWTCVTKPDGTMVFAGEGDTLLRYSRGGFDRVARTPRFAADTVYLAMTDDSYTKRAVRDPTSGRIFLARTSGHVYVVEDGGARLLGDMDSAVRDITVDPEGRFIYIVCEDGTARKLDAGSGASICSFRSPAGQPLWALSHNPDRHLLAVGERGGGLFMLDDGDFSIRFRGLDTARCKRIRWVDRDVLLYNYMDEIHRVDLMTGHRSRLIAGVGNTIEDFIWDEAREYLVFISYTQNLYLSDFTTGEVINWVPDQMDYSKGLAWIPRTNVGSYALDLVTFGRSGTAHHFRIHDEKILALGAMSNLRCEVR
jgi:WD40 repeat protein